MREDLAARLDRMVNTFEESRGRIRAANDAIAELRVTRQSDDGSVEATIGADQRVVDLYIADSALRAGDGRLLARTVLGLITEAQSEWARTAQVEYQRLGGLNLDPAALREPDAADALGRLSRELFGA